MKRTGSVLLGGAACLWMVQVQAAGQTATALPQAEQSGPAEIIVRGKAVPAAEAPRSSTCEMALKDTHFAAVSAASRDRSYNVVTTNLNSDGTPAVIRNEVYGVLAPMVLQPTRMPRNPDYSKAAIVPPGTPLPGLGTNRFNGPSDVRDPNAAGVVFQQQNVDVAANQVQGGEATDGQFVNVGADLQNNADPTRDELRAACRGRYARGNGGGGTRVNTSKIGDVEDFDYFTPESRLDAAEARFANGRAEIASRDRTLPMGFALFDAARYAEALDWFKRASNKLPYDMGGDEAALFVGKIYLEGLGPRSDSKQALQWLRKAATAPYNPMLQTPIFDPRQPDKNSAIGEASIILANIYNKGFRGIDRDPGQARKWYARAWEVGHIPAAKMLGDLHMIGTSLPRNPKKAAQYYRMAAKYGLTSAEVALADLLFNGDVGLPANRKEALAWYNKAAERDEPVALVALGRAYDLGEGVKSDPQKAIGFYKTAAMQGNASAKTALGTYFHEGRLVAKNEATARTWFESAAEDKEPDGMFNLAAMMATGQGGQRDLTSAWMWLKEATVRGHQQAPVAMAAVEKQMSPAELQLTGASRRQ